MNINYYHILDVPTTATDREIKLAYKKLAIQYHPDKHQGNTYFEEKFKQVNEAYQILSNPKKRAIYDLKLNYLLQERLRQQAQQQRYRYEPPVRQPASYSERHYRPIPKSQFLRKDMFIVAAIFAGIILFSLLVKFVMDHVAALDNYKSAITYIEQEKWSTAHAHLSEAIYFKPKYAAAYFKRAYLEMEIRKNYGRALADLDAAITYADEKTPQMYYLRGKCYQELQNYPVAELDLSRAINADKAFALAYYDRGMIRARELNKYPEAIQDFTNYLNSRGQDKDMRLTALFYRGFCHYLTLKNAAAINDYRTALQQDIKNARLYYLLGKAQAELDSTTAACANFTKAFNLGYEAAYGDLNQYCR